MIRLPRDGDFGAGGPDGGVGGGPDGCVGGGAGGAWWLIWSRPFDLGVYRRNSHINRRPTAEREIREFRYPVAESATHRNPMWVVAVSCDCGDRAAGRYRWQYSGAHRCEPPLSVWLIAGSAGPVGAQHAFGG